MNNEVETVPENDEGVKEEETEVVSSAEEEEVSSEEIPSEEKTKNEEPLQMQLLRLQADFDNFRKRTERERVALYQRANENLLNELITILDHFEIGLETAEKHDSDRAVIDGFQLVYDQLLGQLKKFGLQPVDAQGEVFDPHQHEAATYMPSEEHPEDTVITQTRRGYRLGDKLLRAAQVVVSSGPPPAAAAEEDEA